MNIDEHTCGALISLITHLTHGLNDNKKSHIILAGANRDVGPSSCHTASWCRNASSGATSSPQSNSRAAPGDVATHHPNLFKIENGENRTRISPTHMMVSKTKTKNQRDKRKT